MWTEQRLLQMLRKNSPRARNSHALRTLGMASTSRWRGKGVTLRGLGRCVLMLRVLMLRRRGGIPLSVHLSEVSLQITGLSHADVVVVLGSKGV